MSLCTLSYSTLLVRYYTVYTMILQRISIIVGDAGLEAWTSALEVWRATNEPPHLLMMYY